MRLSSLRALLLTLAMVVQTVAGGWSVAHAAAGASRTTISAHCEKMHGGGHAGDAHHGGHPSCDNACCLCEEPGSFALSLFDAHFTNHLFVTTPGFVVSNLFSAPAPETRRRFARGPPAVART
ncbi:MAG: hypothetical protein CTY15_08380 [Methylocystis sp.]|nr:MAG: hypothetical protein CTY15_08380 [Methylocystis sp.]